MALPVAAVALWAALTTVMTTVVASIPDSAKRISKEEFARIFLGEVSEAESAAIKDAFQKMGLDIDPENGINERTLTDAINNGPLAGTGVELTNIFDREAIKRDLTRLALVQAAQGAGLKLTSTKTEAVTEAVKTYIAEIVREEIKYGGDIVDAAPDLVAIVKMIDAARKDYRNEAGDVIESKPLLMSEAAIDNRRRQAKYRANHKRRWVAK